MAGRRMARDSFDALVEVKAKRYRLDQSDSINKALHQLRAHSRPVLRPSYSRKEEDPEEDRKYTRSAWRKNSRDDYVAPSYRSSTRDLEEEEEDYYKKSTPRLPSRAQGYLRPSVAQRDYSPPSSTERDYGHLSARDYDRSASRNFRSPALSREEFVPTGRPGYDDAEYPLAPQRDFSPALHLGRGKHGLALLAGVLNTEELAGPVKNWNLQGLAEDPRGDLLEGRVAVSSLSTQPAPQMSSWRPKGAEDHKLPHADPNDIFSTFGTEIIRWAGFQNVLNDPEYEELYQALFTVQTETCAKTLAAFKCALKHEHRQYCIYSMKNIQHTALRKPQVDNTFLNFLMAHQVIENKQDFFEVVGPFDRVLMKLQFCLLKAATPLLMACNGYELKLRAGALATPAQVSAALETTIGLCRKALVFLGQTFAQASSERQEKVLDALGILQAAPSPALFPNLDTSALFGREYIEHLRSWLEKSGYRMRLNGVGTSLLPQSLPAVQEATSKVKVPQRADQKVVETIEKLVSDVVSGVLTDSESSEWRSAPEYWFLHEKESLEYKYYQLKLSEVERQRAEEEKSPEQIASEAVQALLYRKKIVSLKKKLFRRKKPGILQRAAQARRRRRVTMGTQTLLTASAALKELSQDGHGATADPGDPFSDGFLVLPDSLESRFPNVDPQVMVTAQKLAEFVAEVGPEIEQFSIENSAGNPDLWFLQDRKSPAFQYYRLKVLELCPTIEFIEPPEEPPPESPTEETPTDEEEEEEEEEEQDKDSWAEETKGLEGSVEAPAEGAEGLVEAPTEGQEGSVEAPAVGQEGSVETPAEGPVEAPAEGPAGSDMAAPVLQGVSPAPPGGPPVPTRKRVSSKSLKVGLIPTPKRVCLTAEPKVHDPIQIAYDRPRRYPSHKNKKPKDVEFKHKQLNQKNIGFQMLQKMGWKEGLGLGTHGEGIKEPVQMAPVSSGEGLGVTEDKQGVTEDTPEDTFASFRNRMTQMYYMKRGNKLE